MEEVEERIKALEERDRLHQGQIRLIFRLQSIFVGLIAVGGLIAGGVVRDEGNRALLERIAVGVIGAGAAGLMGSGFVDELKGD